jgi:hypothetical protein
MIYDDTRGAASPRAAQPCTTLCISLVIIHRKLYIGARANDEWFHGPCLGEAVTPHCERPVLYKN